jgi:hypothetical protein
MHENHFNFLILKNQILLKEEEKRKKKYKIL